MTNVWPPLLVIGAGVITFIINQRLETLTVTSLSNAALVSTLTAVVWYTLETRRLRLQQDFDSEIRNHPWLKGSDLKLEREVEGGLAGSETLFLPITNVGTTPAHNLSIYVAWKIEGENFSAGDKKIEEINIASGDTLHARLCNLEFDSPHDHASITVEIAYKSFTGGRGLLRSHFYSHEKGWSNRPTSSYEFWLADGSHFPKSK